MRYLRLQPFIVTLAGMFLARGLCYLISIDSISITDAGYTAIAQTRIPLGSDSASITVGALLALVMMAIGIWLAHGTEFGRTVYAIGGSEASAVLMGLPAGRTKIAVYSFSGFCSSLAGIVWSLALFPLWLWTVCAVHGTRRHCRGRDRRHHVDRRCG